MDIMEPGDYDSGDIVHRSFRPGYVILSCLVSLIGASTTLELLHRRTALRGWYNWYLLITSCATMGGIAIWCMHYIGNRAIVVGDGDLESQIIYNPGVTAASFFVPILALIVPFRNCGISEHVSKLRIFVSGTLTGLAICGMHYLGQAGIANYTSVYHPAYVVGSAVIAVVASVTALGIFFILRATWTNSWWKRLLCAALLAGGVSGMHWLGTIGTEYRSKEGSPLPNGLSSGAAVIVVLVLSVSSCILLFFIATVTRAQGLRDATKAKQVVLACATFDGHGRLLVTPEGLLPSQKITGSYIEQSPQDIFSTAHDNFRWVYHVSHTWRAVTELIPSMRMHARASEAQKCHHLTAQMANSDHMGCNLDYSFIFKELFCIAAQDLADQIHENLEDIGTLYDEIMSTGTIDMRGRRKSWFSSKGDDSLSDLERGKLPPVFGRGQVLFVVRQVKKSEATRLQASGFRFTDVQNVADTVAKKMQVSREALVTCVGRMHRYAGRERELGLGIHLACFAVRPIVSGSFDILVRRDATNLLPTVPLQSGELEAPYLELLNQMHDWTVAACLSHLRRQVNSLDVSRTDQAFLRHLLNRLNSLVEQIAHPFFLDARFIGRPIPVASPSNSRTPQHKTHILAFHVLADLHMSTPNPAFFKFSPYAFFKTQQDVYSKSSLADANLFAAEVAREFAPILADGKTAAAGTATPGLGTRPGSPFSTAANRHSMHSASSVRDGLGPARPRRLDGIKSVWPFGVGASAGRRSSRRTSLERVGSHSSGEALVTESKGLSFGGITVRNDVRVEISDADAPPPTTSTVNSDETRDVELKNFEARGQGGRMSSVVSAGTEAAATGFWDELFGITVGSWR